MAKYLVCGKFTAEGAEGLRREGGTGRRDALGKLAESLGGSLEAFYFAFGEVDTAIIVDLPTPQAAAALALAVGEAGRVTMTTTVLLTPEQVDAARDLAPAYRPPGIPG